MSDVGIGLAGIGLLFLLLAMRVPIGMALVSAALVLARAVERAGGDEIP